MSHSDYKYHYECPKTIMDDAIRLAIRFALCGDISLVFPLVHKLRIGQAVC